MTPLPSAQQLRYLITLAELRHFGRAALACSVTQSTLSAGILALERQLDVQLLDRNVGKRVVFTPIGDEVAARARFALETLQAVQDVADASRAPMTGLLRIGVIPTIGPFIMPGLVSRLRRQFPQIRLSVNEDLTGNVMDKLALGRLDLVLLAMPCPCEGTETLPLWRDEFMLLLPADHALAALDSIPVERIAGERMVLLEDGHCLREQTLSLCRQERGWSTPDGDEEFVVTSLYTLVDMVAEGLGIALLPRLAVESGILRDLPLVVRPVTGCQAWRTIGLAWRPRSPRAADFRQLGLHIRPPAVTAPAMV
ncbi:transcriptional regulator, LysR family [Gluconacetobacter diazotrophicus PA1 5]|uniref:Hydrogen peroxide-inducible genes activator n=2 Tax=Gluconacetobacter diazotrophicus TaxID=33996 RepID=A0A7W4FC89_GLUDI|nr:hydrogen peroxide-inducible genes activator [Gluconacetobacter diazotrophicus]ACI51202.1 transcriptional regulator, LysR family [Gluconacetobacter diazotrophicus PA1 5]MBB2155085.1 hydrogen peroxide-inducible genes activator [Gluconacetobacter diazotrophicus]TWB09758.1 LysR family hydrogen peroxide-inducible transcriptional activator [Gluconacetobacter diazotrophicus]CAP54521.1 putative transcriptional Regulator, LysR family [Gluconacetobacter diazotrophicus PA1 5]